MIGLLAHFFGVQAQQPVENDGVQMGQVELALALGQAGQRRGHRLRLATQQQGSTARHGDKRGALLRLQRFDIARRIRRRQRLDREELLRGAEKAAGSKSARLCTTRCVGKITSPSESMFTKVIITAASG